MSKTLRRIVLIPLKNYIDLTFHPSFQAPHSFNSLSCYLSPLNLFPCPSSSSWSFSCTSSKSTSLSIACQHQTISGSLWALAAKSSCHIWWFETVHHPIQSTTEQQKPFKTSLKTLHLNSDYGYFYVLPNFCYVLSPFVCPCPSSPSVSEWCLKHPA